jgi:hypothetical protein
MAGRPTQRRNGSQQSGYDNRPILFVDVDGVISLFGFDAAGEPPGEYHTVDGILHCIGSACGERLARLKERFELVWATGWEDRANEHLPFLLQMDGDLPTLTFDGRATFGTAHWKLGAIEEYAGGRPAAWIDDSHDDNTAAWARARAREIPTLLVATNPARGIEDWHVDRLLEWADDLERGRAGAWAAEPSAESA